MRVVDVCLENIKKVIKGIKTTTSYVLTGALLGFGKSSKLDPKHIEPKDLINRSQVEQRVREWESKEFTYQNRGGVILETVDGKVQRVRNYEPPKKPKNKHERYLEFKKSLEREPVDKVNTVDGYVVELYEEPRDKTL